MNLLRTMCVCALMVGCSQAHPSDEVEAGIYDLTVFADSEACSPSRAVGPMGPVAVLVEGSAIDAPVPDLASPSLLTAPRVTLTGESFHAETNRRVPGCDDTFVHEEWTLIESSRDGFELLHSQEWHGLAECEAAPATMPGAPSADCMSERRLRYELAEPCAAPCRLILGAAGALSCSC